MNYRWVILAITYTVCMTAYLVHIDIWGDDESHQGFEDDKADTEIVNQQLIVDGITIRADETHTFIMGNNRLRHSDDCPCQQQTGGENGQ